MNKEKFQKWLDEIPFEEKEPFCPWDTIYYCNDAYSIKCYDCEIKQQYKGDDIK